MSSSFSALPAVFAVFAACGGSSITVPHTDVDGGMHATGDAGHGADSADATPAQGDAQSSSSVSEDASHEAASSMAVEAGGDATRNSSCTPTSEETGTAVNSDHGRLDGTLVYVVDVGTGQQCNGDDSHVHLQIEVSGSIYDVAVDIGTAPNDEVGMYQETLAVPGGAWSEGWHGTDTLAYPSLGVHSTSFVTAAPDTIATQVETLLASTTKISIFCKGYAQGNGCHDVHYEDGSGEDGAIVLSPTEAMSPLLFFRFTSQTF